MTFLLHCGKIYRTQRLPLLSVRSTALRTLSQGTTIAQRGLARLPSRTLARTLQFLEPAFLKPRTALTLTPGPL